MPAATSRSASWATYGTRSGEPAHCASAPASSGPRPRPNICAAPDQRAETAWPPGVSSASQAAHAGGQGGDGRTRHDARHEREDDAVGDEEQPGTGARESERPEHHDAAPVAVRQAAEAQQARRWCRPRTRRRRR
jgi:hypothetical protein